MHWEKNGLGLGEYLSFYRNILISNILFYSPSVLEKGVHVSYYHRCIAVKFDLLSGSGRDSYGTWAS